MRREAKIKSNTQKRHLLSKILMRVPQVYLNYEIVVAFAIGYIGDGTDSLNKNATLILLSEMNEGHTKKEWI